MIGEVAIGAALVLGKWVGDDTSVARAVIDGFHLVNTLLLLAALALTAWWAGGGPPIRLRGESPEGRLLVWGLGALLVVAAAGALTALGDTLVPDASIADDISSRSHFLVRLRVLHPILAVATAVYLVLVARRLATKRRGFQASLAVLVGSIVGFQVIVGIVNLALGAPVWMQVVHVMVTDALWIAVVVLTAAELVVDRVLAA
jgi:heme A synthase